MDKVLIIGGTNFIGRNLIEGLLQLDLYDITLFNRGQSNPHLFPKVKKLIGDRNTSDVNLIFQDEWDFVIDLSCYFPNSLKQIVKQLTPSLKKYIFISTCSVYDSELDNSILRDEKAPILKCSESQSIDSSMSSYGNRKARCERILIESGLKYAILRPALVYGKYDNTDRFYYWLYHVKMGSQLLLPNKGNDLFSVTYVMDVVQAIVTSLKSGAGATVYNVISHPQTSISQIIATASRILNMPLYQNIADTEFLNKHNVNQWTDLPLWIDGDHFTFDNSKALKELNLEVAEYEKSVHETISYYDSLVWKEPKYGMSEEIRKELIHKLCMLE